MAFNGRSFRALRGSVPRQLLDLSSHLHPLVGGCTGMIARVERVALRSRSAPPREAAPVAPGAA
jgi:hypothetical protein